MLKKALLPLFVMALAISLAGTLHAAGSMGARVVVVASCMIETISVDFGFYSGDTIEDKEGEIRVRCTAGTGYHIALDAGGSLSGLWRGMTNASGGRMNYGIFKQPNYTGLWGDNDYGSTYGFGSSFADSANGAWQLHHVYSRLFGSQPYSAGSMYSDTVNVTLHY